MEENMCRCKFGHRSAALPDGGNSGAAVAINPFRLPRNVLPESYKLFLKPDLKSGTYEGSATIKVHVLEAIDSIALNAITFDDPDPKDRKEANLVIGKALIANSEGTAFTCQVEAEPEAERIHLKVNGTIGIGAWTLKVHFQGKLNDHMKGFYRSTYKDANGGEHVIATTQFESTDARRAFPCFDEPDMKATFQVTMEVAEDLTVISNTKVVSEKLVPKSRRVIEENAGNNFFGDEVVGSGRKVVEFAPTMKMSTYILAFVVGNLARTKPVVVDGVEVSAYCVPGKEKMTNFGIRMAQFALRYYRKYFGVAYPGDKLDIAAIPDFAAGAMENMGIATFREEAMLVDEATASQGALNYVAEVVAHEIAHMWFGNLVTMRWWNGLWLNEAFATFMSYKCSDAWMKKWKVWDKFGLSRAAAFRTDGLKTTRSIEFPVVSPDDAMGMFDVLTYEKGCSVMRMLEMFMGEESFRKGIALYMKNHAYGNTEGADLWAALSTASGMDVNKIMHGWIWTPGFPVISVNLSDGGGSITLKQSQFKYLAEGVNAEQLWQVPVLLRAKTAEGEVEVKHLLTSAAETVYLGEGLEWVVANAGGHGFYRVTYSDELAAKLTANAQKTLSVIERANLLGDEWACVQAGLGTALEFVKLVKLFGEENDPNVWAFITGPLATLRRLLPEGKRAKYESMVCDLIGPALTRLGFEPAEGEATQIAELRADLLATLALTGNDSELHGKARELFAKWKSDKNSVDGDIISSAVRIVAATGDETHYNEFHALFKASADPEDQSRFRGALVGFRNADLVERTLNLCLDRKEIRPQDAPGLLGGAIGNEVSSQRAWVFLKANWDQLAKLLQDPGMIRIFASITSLDTAEMEADVQAFYADHPIKGAGKMPVQYLEMQRINRLLRDRESAALTAEYAA
jgi:puromycin-sensitive aminopeptidase